MKKSTLSIFLFICLLLKSMAFASGDVQIIDIGADVNIDNSKGTYANAISANGTIIGGGLEVITGTYDAFYYDQRDNKMIVLGSLRTDNSGGSQANAISGNGLVVVGLASAEDNDYHAYRYKKGDTKMTDLGTLKSDNSGMSDAMGVSADGRIVVGYAATDDGLYHAFRHNEGDMKMIDLGTLKSDNSGVSEAINISADGRVIVGHSDIDITGYHHAFRHSEGNVKMIDLGTLNTDNSGNSYASAVSADGRVVVGWATSSMGDRAFRHNEGDTKMTDLGTLRADNSGSSTATAVSADGRVVVGSSATDSGFMHAFRHNEGDMKMVDLGTLRADDSGSSTATAVSADGRVVVGSGITNTNETHAFRYDESNSKMVDLGTLKVDNSGMSYANALSADGTVVIGQAQNDFGSYRAVVWKTTKAVDIMNAYTGMSKTASKAVQVFDLYQNGLYMLTNSRCQLGEDNYCLGFFSRYNKVRQSNNLTGGLYGALRLLNEQWSVGGSINVGSDTDLVKNYNTHGNTFPGIGLFTRYQTHRDNSGFNAEIAGSYIKQNLSISREKLMGSEVGKGNSKIKGYSANITLGYGINILPRTQLTPLVGLQYYKVSRDAYTENRQADFLAHYNELYNKSTDIQLGFNLNHAVTHNISVEANIGSYINLNSKRNAFKSEMDYFGSQYYERLKARGSKPYARIGANLEITKNSTLTANIGWSKTDYRKEASFIGVGYSYHW